MSRADPKSYDSDKIYFSNRHGRPEKRDEESGDLDLKELDHISNVLHLPQSLAQRHLEDLLYSIKGQENIYVINLASLHRLNLQHLRRQLAEAASKVNRGQYSEADGNRCATTMAMYCMTLS